MRSVVIVIFLIFILALPVSAMDIQAPDAPESAQKYMPKQSSTFGDDLWYIFKNALSELGPSVSDAAGVCLSLVAVSLLVSVASVFTGSAKSATELVGTLMIGALLIRPFKSLVALGTETISQISDYGKMLLPVMTGALAAQGGVTASGGLYIGTALLDTVLTSLINRLIVPILYVFICLAVANGAIGDKTLKELKGFSKWSMTWMLKTVLYIFTGYMGITGVVSGTVDASALKAAKLAISSGVPVVGNILSDASEAILVSAGVMKNAAGVYGLLVVFAMCIGPFLRIGVQYLLVKMTAAVCAVFGTKRTSELIGDISAAMGIVLSMTGTVCLLQLISTVCFMKGVA